VTAPVPAGDGIGGLCDRLEEWLYAHSDDTQPDLLAAALLEPDDGPLADLLRLARDGLALRAGVERLAEELKADGRAAQDRAAHMDRTDEKVNCRAVERRHARVAIQAASALRAVVAAAGEAS
jgi:hypothetical protein